MKASRLALTRQVVSMTRRFCTGPGIRISSYFAIRAAGCTLVVTSVPSQEETHPWRRVLVFRATVNTSEYPLGTLGRVGISPRMQASTEQLLAVCRGDFNGGRGRTTNNLAFEEVSECANRDASILTKAKHGPVAGHDDVCFSRYSTF
jgi:hypothetical protein